MTDKSASSAIAHHRESDNTSQRLEAHLVGVSALARSFAEKLGVPFAGELIGLLHDLGKYSTQFQSYIGSALGQIDQDEDGYVDHLELKGKVDHSTAGAQLIWNKLSSKGPLEKALAQILALCIASHHSGLIDCLQPDGVDRFGRRMTKSDDLSHLEEVKRAADERVIQRANEIFESAATIAELRAMVERVVKHAPTPTTKALQLGLATRMLFSCLIDGDRVDTIDFEKKRKAGERPLGRYADWETLAERLETKLATFVPTSPIDHVRNRIAAECLAAADRPAGTYTLTVPTGGGKTLASLRFALHHAKQRQLDHVIYVIPFTSIIEQNASVVRDILEDDASHDRVVLEHHSNISPENQTWREKMISENWDAPVVYTTMVQFLEAAFGRGTRGARRMHQLARSVIVFDEIQSVPINCVYLFNNAVNYLTKNCESTVLLCTATQPLLHLVHDKQHAIDLAPNAEIVTDVSALFKDLERVKVADACKPGGWEYSEIADLAIAEVQRAGSCLVVVNTKASAKAVYAAAKAREFDNTAIFHLSTDMCPNHRRTVLAAIRERLASDDSPVLCVSTQLIEAGVDVDFGAAIRCIAGLDSIAQAAGRCNRHGKRATGTVHVVNPREETLKGLPEIACGAEKTKRVLGDYVADPDSYGSSLLNPIAMKEYYSYYFFDRQAAMAYPVAGKDDGAEVGMDTTLVALLGDNKTILDSAMRGVASSEFEGRVLFQSFATAANAFKSIDAPTRGVVVPYGFRGRELIAELSGSAQLATEYRLLREAQQFSVNVFPHVLKKLVDAGAIYELAPNVKILCLNERYYSEEFGLATEPVSTMGDMYV